MMLAELPTLKLHFRAAADGSILSIVAAWDRPSRNRSWLPYPAAFAAQRVTREALEPEIVAAAVDLPAAEQQGPLFRYDGAVQVVASRAYAAAGPILGAPAEADPEAVLLPPGLDEDPVAVPPPSSSAAHPLPEDPDAAADALRRAAQGVRRERP